ncbi:MAG TPA: alpha/beta hydrolase-fold protein [Luteitalea sp.]|nr:alpha/beta hydrolase-fold protein [Luteitalea sp.]
MSVDSAALATARTVYVWVPSTYDDRPDHSYPVIYMQDGQNLFTDALAFGQEWQVDEHLERLSGLGLEAIVVGIANGEDRRLDEYSPFTDAEGRGGRGDDYLRFVIDELMPLVASRFRVRRDRDGVGIMGSSMGALISLYGFLTRPEVFGFVGAMSPAIWFAEAAILGTASNATFAGGRVYMDIGTQEGDTHVDRVHDLHRILIEKGHRQGESLFYVEEDDAEHTEAAWAHRLRTALYFLLPAPPSPADPSPATA